jgi:hypothetical protein
MDSFGDSVAVSGDTALVGAYRKSGAAVYAGAAYMFVRSGATSTQQAELPDPAPIGLGDAFGAPLALQGITALIGAPGKNADAGVAYVIVPSTMGTAEDGPAE